MQRLRYCSSTMKKKSLHFLFKRKKKKKVCVNTHTSYARWDSYGSLWAFLLSIMAINRSPLSRCDAAKTGDRIQGWCSSKANMKPQRSDTSLHRMSLFHPEVKYSCVYGDWKGDAEAGNVSPSYVQVAFIQIRVQNKLTSPCDFKAAQL